MKNIYDQNYYYSFAIDLTNRCNGKCLFCPRNNNFSNKMKTLGELSLDTFKKTFDNVYLNHIRNIVLNGNLGDPTLYSKLFELLDYISSVNKNVKILLATNGSTRPENWWKELAEKMSFNNNNRIRFGIDGLEDTHHLYRGTNFNKVFNNMKAFIDGGGKAVWQYIVFKHNQHQVDEALKIATDIGCDSFVKLISRCYNMELERPTSMEAETKNELCATSTERKIFCTPIENRHLYISHEGFLYPCCDFGLFEDFRKIEKYPERLYIEYLKSLKYMDLSRNTIDTALNTSFFQYVFNNKEGLSRCKVGCRIENNNCNERIQIQIPINKKS